MVKTLINISKIFLVITLLLQACNESVSPAEIFQAPVVERIYPENDSLPENILKFYIAFSQPMREGDFLSHVRLENEKGENMTGVFFDNVYELWTPDHKMLTLLVDPGRVKTGLWENQKRGRAFKAGQRYTLTVDTTWRSIRGDFLSKPYKKKIVAIQEDIIPPDFSQVRVMPVKAGSRKPAEILFPEEMDVLQILSYLSIIDDEDEPVPGEIAIFERGRKVHFTPFGTWQDSNYRLRIDVRMEDIAANSFTGKFDLPSGEKRVSPDRGYLFKEIHHLK